MKIINLLFAISFILYVPTAGAEQTTMTGSSGTNLAHELSLKLADLGSFQAEYRAVSPDKSSDITLLFNKEMKYCMCKLTTAEANQQDIYSVLDFSNMNGKRGDFHILMVSGDKGKRFTISLRDIFKRLDNPLGILFFMAEQFRSNTKIGPDKIDIKSGAPSLSMGLSEDSIALGVGITSKDDYLTTSWLDTDTIANAVRIQETSDAVQFSYKSDHIVWVDKKTGLLLKETWPDPARPGPRNITLLRHSVLKRNTPYSALIPAFHRIEFEDLPPEYLYKAMFVSFLTDLGRQLSGIDHFDEVFDRHSADITAAVRKMGREMIREEARKRISNKKAEKFAKEILLPSYEQYGAQHAKKGNNLSFPDFLSYLMLAAEDDPSLFMSPGSRELTERIKKECESIFDQLPKDALQPLKKIYDKNMSAIIEGWMLEFLSAYLDQAKTLELKSQKGS